MIRLFLAALLYLGDHQKGEIEIIADPVEAAAISGFQAARLKAKAGEGIEEAALRELQEETGLKVERLVFLGSMAPDSGIVSSVTPVYAGWVAESGQSECDESEAIAGIYPFTILELEEGLQNGYIEIEPQGKVPLRDSYLTFALYQKGIRKL